MAHKVQTTYTVDDAAAVRAQCDAAGHFTKVDGNSITVMCNAGQEESVRKLVEGQAPAEEEAPAATTEGEGEETPAPKRRRS